VDSLVRIVVQHGFPVTLAEAPALFEAAGLRATLVPLVERHPDSSGTLSWSGSGCQVEMLPIRVQSNAEEQIVVISVSCKAFGEREARKTLDRWRRESGVASIPAELPVHAAGPGRGTAVRGQVMRIGRPWQTYFVMNDPEYAYVE
jgi:hypothetical protein